MKIKNKKIHPSKSKSLNKNFKSWAIFVVLVKVIVIYKIPSQAIEINGKPFLLDGIWLGADGENYLKGFSSLLAEGIFSKEAILNYWPAGYPLVILFLSFFGKSWVLTTLAIFQSIVFSYSAYFFAFQLSRTRIKKLSFLVLICILLNPTLSLSSISIGYESLTASGFLLIIGIIIKDLIEQQNKNFKYYLAGVSLISSIVVFVQPRFVIATVAVTFLWIINRMKQRSWYFLTLLSIILTLIFPSTLILRNYESIGEISISTNLGVTMNIGAGPNATGGYMQKGYGVPCKLQGSSVDQDRQLIACVTRWYVDNPHKALSLFYYKSLFFWSPWHYNGFLGDVNPGTMARNPWFKVSPIIQIASSQNGLNLIYSGFAKIISWLILLGSIFLLFYGFIALWRQKFLERFLAKIALVIVVSNWLISLVTIGDHRFRIPIMGLSIFLQVIGLNALIKGGKLLMAEEAFVR